ncbi:putative oxygen-insensitive NADPH nitroreductase [Paenibacillus sp. oral taxon 786 str. D14]|uniref:oxygen-insensitive NADPH nitroreductase n=1 Tax=Paenibacillus sp. oral taxon 786 TaxID=652715 RepID=UPI0001AFD406|nr:oxygen-insensitive NADPH nitroreductase [Paenibacillus sp. oral taxon 786]EES74215.1 putative oxygen-insensitive NADPH nitroreductase [Paenibacillus sp. oral taxon 786 str. D14]
MNETISKMLEHRSIRKYSDRPVTRELVEQIISAGQMASSSSNVQAYTVIAVTDADRKAKLAELCGNQAYVAECPVFLVWCADLSRLKRAAERHLPSETTYEGTTENFIVATVDTALAAQNAAIAAESLGLGIVYIGGIRNHSEEVADLLDLPHLSYPVFGMCLGYPDQNPGVRPRLPLPAILHWNQYDTAGQEEQVAAYDEVMSKYLSERTGGAKDTPWSELMAEKLAQPARLHMREFLEKRGFTLK